MKTCRFLYGLILFSFFSGSLFAVMPPKYEMQRKKYLVKRAMVRRAKAQLVLKVRVLDLKKSPWRVSARRGIWRVQKHTVSAEVLRVVRGKYERRRIEFRYYRKAYCRGAVGPMIWNAKLLQKGGRYRVWLDTKRGSWRAAAGLLSFE